LGRFHLGLAPQAPEMPLLRSYSAGDKINDRLVVILQRLTAGESSYV